MFSDQIIVAFFPELLCNVRVAVRLAIIQVGLQNVIAFQIQFRNKAGLLAELFHQRQKSGTVGKGLRRKQIDGLYS